MGLIMGIKNSKGFSLVEMMIVSAIMMTLAYAMMQQFEIQQKMATTSDAQFDMQDLLTQTRSILSNEAACTETFRTKPLAGATATEIKRAYKNNPTDTVWQFSVFANLTADFSKNLKLKTISIAPSPASPTSQGIITLEISRLKKVFGGDTLTRTITVDVKTDVGGLITSCQFMGSPAPNAKEICEALNGTYNTTTLKCDTTAVDGIPIYRNPKTGALQLESTSTVYETCSQCKDNCNPCPSGWTMTNQNCSQGANCGLHKWRNCSARCSITAVPAGKMLGALPSPIPPYVPPVVPTCPSGDTAITWYNTVLTLAERIQLNIEMGIPPTSASVPEIIAALNDRYPPSGICP